MAVPPTGRNLRVGFQTDWDPHTAGPGHHGLLSWDPRVRTLLRVLVSYPEVRYVLPDRISLESSADPRTLDAALHAIPGVVETGLFVGRADVVLVAHATGVERLVR